VLAKFRVHLGDHPLLKNLHVLEVAFQVIQLIFKKYCSRTILGIVVLNALHIHLKEPGYQLWRGLRLYFKFHLALQQCPRKGGVHSEGLLSILGVGGTGVQLVRGGRWFRSRI
jgi:hypothetical protein